MAKELRTIVLEDSPVLYDGIEHGNLSLESRPTEQRRFIIDEEDAGAEYVQAFIDNISFPKSLEELEFFIDEMGDFSLERLLSSSVTTWTAPRWAKIGDIVFFMHAKYARSTITRLRTQLNREKHLYSPERFKELASWIERGLKLHSQYGGRIVAVGRVSGPPTADSSQDSEENIFHWKSRVYAEMDRITRLEHPVHMDEFSEFIRISREGAITPVLGNSFERLRELIERTNRIPRYLKESVSSPIPLTKITDENWISLPAEYRRRFVLESQFRSYYVDHLLFGVKDKRTRLYSECRCKKTGIPDSFVDNVIIVNKKYLPVEVKLSVSSQSNILGQVWKYSNDDTIICGDKSVLPEQIYTNRVLIIDTDYVYIYDADNNTISPIFTLDNMNNMTGIHELRRMISHHLSN